MFISVDLPAPFSPSSACTSPRRRSKSTWSFASTPGKRFVMPRSSRTGVSGELTSGGSLRRRRGAGLKTRPSTSCVALLLDLRRRLDLAGDDLRLQLLELLAVDRRDLRAHLAESNTTVLQVEDEVGAAAELTALRALDGEVHAGVDALDGAREDVRPEVRLVDVHADPPDAGLLGRVQRAEPARAGDVELDLRALVDLVLRDRLALGRVDEVLRVADEDLHAGVALLRAGLIAREEAVDRR